MHNVEKWQNTLKILRCVNSFFFSGIGKKNYKIGDCLKNKG